MSVGRSCLLALLALVCAAAVAESARLGWASLLSRHPSREAMENAVRLAPDEPGYRKALAELLDRAGNRDAARRHRERAVALNAWDSAVWITLGLEAETQGDLPRAERALLEAARRNRTHGPAWALANFYFRQSNDAGFWPWARRAAETAYGDFRPLFRLCWMRSSDAGFIFSRVIPAGGEPLRQYVKFLAESGRLRAASAAAARLAANAAPDDRQALEFVCDRLIDAGAGESALAIWNAMVARKLVAGERLVPQAGHSLTNARFSWAPSSHGFDWRISEIDGVELVFDSRTAPLAISFTGRQPEQTIVIRQFLPILPGRECQFQFEYRTEGIAPGTGLYWEIAAAGKRAQSPDLSSPEWSAVAVPFTAPAPELATVSLRYERRAGTTRIEGSLSVRNLRFRL